MAEEPEPIYSDGVQVGCAPFTVALLFTISAAPPPAQDPNEPPVPQLPQRVADIRMSPEHAKVMTIILMRQLKEFERILGRPIPIHPSVMQQLGLSPSEDW